MNGVEVYSFNINGNTTFNSSAVNIKSALINPSYSLTEQVIFSLCKLLSLPKLFLKCAELIVFLIATSDISALQILVAVEVHRYSFLTFNDPTLSFDLELLATAPTSIPIFFFLLSFSFFLSWRRHSTRSLLSFQLALILSKLPLFQRVQSGITSLVATRYFLQSYYQNSPGVHWS